MQVDQSWPSLHNRLYRIARILRSLSGDTLKAPLSVTTQLRRLVFQPIMLQLLYFTVSHVATRLVTSWSLTRKKGDPLNGQSVGSLSSSRVKEFCGKRSSNSNNEIYANEITSKASGDGVCEGGGFAITAAHLSYGSGPDLEQGAQFIVQQAGATGSSGGSSPPASSASASPDPSSTSSSGLGGFNFPW